MTPTPHAAPVDTRDSGEYLHAPELPLEGIARLTRAAREQRVQALVADAERIVEEALSVHLEGHELVGTVLLFSGGSDSTVLGHLMRHRATHAAHANTGIGIEQTREFVRDTCHTWGLPLLEKHPPTPYHELVLERGFPGPARHNIMYQRLKERCLEAVRRDLVSRPSRQRVLFLAGRRRAESARRSAVVEHERRGSTIWASPIVNWTALDLNTYRLMAKDVPSNPIAELLHMSGECLCGAFAKPGELDEIGFWFPEVAAQIRQLETEVADAGHSEPWCTWGHGKGRPRSRAGMLCSSCDQRFVQDQLLPD